MKQKKLLRYLRMGCGEGLGLSTHLRLAADRAPTPKQPRQPLMGRLSGSREKGRESSD